MSIPPSSPRLPDSNLRPRKGTSFKPVLITVACTFLLLLGSTFGFLSTCGNWPNSGPQPGNRFFGTCVVFFAVLFFASLAWLGLSFLIWLFAPSKEPEDK